MAPVHVTALNRGGQVAHDLVVGAMLPGSGSLTASWQGRILVLVFAVFGLLILFYLLTHPALLWRRFRVGVVAEPDPRQRVIYILLVLCFLAVFVVSARDPAFGW